MPITSVTIPLSPLLKGTAIEVNNYTFTAIKQAANQSQIATFLLVNPKLNNPYFFASNQTIYSNIVTIVPLKRNSSGVYDLGNVTLQTNSSFEI